MILTHAWYLILYLYDLSCSPIVLDADCEASDYDEKYDPIHSLSAAFDFLLSFRSLIFTLDSKKLMQNFFFISGEPLVLSCLIASEPKAAVHWLKNDLIFMEDSR